MKKDNQEVDLGFTDEPEQNFDVSYTESLPRFNKDQSARSRITELSKAAVDTVYQVMTDHQSKPQLRLQAAQYIIDQAEGKAKQEVHVEQSMLVEFMIKLESKSREAKDVTNSLPPPKDHLDNFLEEFIPEKFIVGDKSGKEE